VLVGGQRRARGASLLVWQLNLRRAGSRAGRCMSGVFDTPEACAARLLFYYLAGEATESELADAWRQLDVGIDATELAAGIAYARKTRADKDAGTERFGFYNLQRAFLGFLEHVRLREEEIVGRGEHGYTRGEVMQRERKTKHKNGSKERFWRTGRRSSALRVEGTPREHAAPRQLRSRPRADGAEHWRSRGR
jgi:hypothetical protein